MAATITASMAGELVKKVAMPSSTATKDLDKKFAKLEEELSELNDRLDPSSLEYLTAQEELIDRFKEEIGIEALSLHDQKKIINSINEKLGTNFEALDSIQQSLNNNSSLLYKNISKNVSNTLSTLNKPISLNKNIVDQLSDSIKTKVQNISPIKTISNSFAGFKDFIYNIMSESSKKLSNFIGLKFSESKNIQNDISKKQYTTSSMIIQLNSLQKDNSLNMIKNQNVISSFFSRIDKSNKDNLSFMTKKSDIISSLINKVSKEQFVELQSSLLDIHKMTDDQMEVLKSKLDPSSFQLVLAKYEKNKKYKDYPFSSTLTKISDNLNSYSEKFKNLNEKMKIFSSPMKMIGGIVEMVSEISSIIFRTLVPTIVSMAVTFFTTVLPIILIVVAAVVLLVIILFLLWKHFGKQIKMVWDYIKQYVVDFLIMWIKNLKEVFLWIWDTLKLAWGVITDIYDFVDAIFSGDFKGAGKIIVRLMDRIADYISKTFEHIFNIFKNFGDFLSKLPIIGPVFKFLFGILMPFMRFFIDGFNWMYFFIKDYISVVWNTLVDTISLIKAIFSGDFSGAGVIIMGIFNRIKDFVIDKVISFLIILQKLGDGLMIPLKWLWETFKVAWDYYSKLVSPIFDWIINGFKAAWDFIYDIIKNIWDFISNPVKLVSSVASKVGDAVSEKFTAVTDTLSSWGSSVVDTINPMNWFAEGKIALEPMRAVFAEAGPEAAIPLNDQGLEFLQKTFNIDDNSFRAMLNNSDLYSAIIEIKDQNLQIIDTLTDIEYKMENTRTPSFYETVSNSYGNMFTAPTQQANKGAKKEDVGETIMKKLEEISTLIKSVPTGESSQVSSTNDSDMEMVKLIASGIFSRR